MEFPHAMCATLSSKVVIIASIQEQLSTRLSHLDHLGPRNGCRRACSKGDRSISEPFLALVDSKNSLQETAYSHEEQLLLAEALLQDFSQSTRKGRQHA